LGERTVEFTEEEVEALRAILDHARGECGAATRAAVEAVDALFEGRGAGVFDYGDLLELRDLLEGVRADRCPVDRDALEGLLSKF
jgi:hypothetical protein